MASTCLVTARDYRTQWPQTAATPVPPPLPYVGPERRVSGVADRRANTHDRRWKAEAGRRLRLGDRRRRAK